MCDWVDELMIATSCDLNQVRFSRTFVVAAVLGGRTRSRGLPVDHAGRLLWCSGLEAAAGIEHAALVTEKLLVESSWASALPPTVVHTRSDQQHSRECGMPLFQPEHDDSG